MGKQLFGTYTSLKYDPEATPHEMMETVRKGIDRLIKKGAAFEFTKEEIVPDFDTMQFIIHLKDKQICDPYWFYLDEPVPQEKDEHIMTVGIKFYGEIKEKTAHD